jgi:hypothetical protein
MATQYLSISTNATLHFTLDLQVVCVRFEATSGARRSRLLLMYALVQVVSLSQLSPFRVYPLSGLGWVFKHSSVIVYLSDNMFRTNAAWKERNMIFSLHNFFCFMFLDIGKQLDFCVLSWWDPLDWLWHHPRVLPSLRHSWEHVNC